MNWQEEYKRKLVTPQEAVKVVKSGDSVYFTSGREAVALGLALAARKEELENVKITVPTAARDFGWYDAGWDSSFEVTVGYCFGRGAARSALDEKRCDKLLGTLSEGGTFVYTIRHQRIDVLFVEVSPPDKNGFCSFGASVWDKNEAVRAAAIVIGEVNQHLIRTYGDNFVHVSEIDYFVEHEASGRVPGEADLLGRPVEESTPVQKQIGEFVGSLISDGDTLQIGVGQATEPLARVGILDNNNDLGWHSEVTPQGIIELVRKGVVNGKRKTIDRGKCVATAIGGGTAADMAYVNMNPLFELRRVVYVNDIRVIASLDNMVAINNALAVDLLGQIAAESLGPRIWGGAGGQPSFVIGAGLSKGGRSITVVPSTAQDGRVSRILPTLPEGTLVTIPAIATHFVVTEYGIADLKGKSVKERIEQLIAIAHPDFRQELKREGTKLFYGRL